MYLNHIIQPYFIKMIIQNSEIKISARFWPIFGFELSVKGHEPSRKSFSSSYGSSQLGSGSSLLDRHLVHILEYKSVLTLEVSYLHRYFSCS